jgi:hypothetical protein
MTVVTLPDGMLLWVEKTMLVEVLDAAAGEAS